MNLNGTWKEFERSLNGIDFSEFAWNLRGTNQIWIELKWMMGFEWEFGGNSLGICFGFERNFEWNLNWLYHEHLNWIWIAAEWNSNGIWIEFELHLNWIWMEWNWVEWNRFEWNGVDSNGMEWNWMEWNCKDGQEWNGIEWNLNVIEWNRVELNRIELQCEPVFGCQELNGIDTAGNLIEWNGAELNWIERTGIQMIWFRKDRNRIEF